MAAVAEADHRFDRRMPRRPGLRGYRAWRWQHHRRRPAGGRGSEITFVVVIETDGHASAEARTRRSIERQTRRPAGVIVSAPRGADLLTATLDIQADFVLALHAGSVLAPDAFDWIARAHRVDPALDVILFDEDRRNGPFRRGHVHFKPREWSPERLLSSPYFGRAAAYRLARLRSLDGVQLDDRGLWAAQLELGLESRRVGTLSEVLLTERAAPAALTEEDAEMVRKHLSQGGEVASVVVASVAALHVELTPAIFPTVSVVIPTRHSRANLSRLLPTLSTTDYPSFDVVIMDNGGQTADNDRWYGENRHGLDVTVHWWTESPFNYSRVNNSGARNASGEVLIFLNDDTEIVDPRWMRALVGFAVREGVGTVGLRLLERHGLIQHGGVTVGPGGFADNLFAGAMPGTETIVGTTDTIRNALAVTGACVAVRREVFDEVGGFDERFVLCGSDVVLGLDQIIAGRRNVVIAADMVRHFESLTRGSSVPAEDFFASYWRYYPWLRAGDPFLSPNVSPLSARPVFASASDPQAVRIAMQVIGKPYVKAVQGSGIAEEAAGLAPIASVTPQQVDAVHRLHAEHTGPLEIRSVNWFIPDIDMPFFGGLNTAFRLAAKLAREHSVRNRFVVLSPPQEAYIRSALVAAFAELADADVVFYDGTDDSLAEVPPADAAVATLWLTASHVAKVGGVRRKFYLMQDFEPAFYPASSLYAMAEESYRLGLYGLCNTESMRSIYADGYGGRAMGFTPAVDRAIFHPNGRPEKGPSDPVTIFAYARDHFRNCWELVYAALVRIKELHGDNVRIIAAGARYLPASADFIDMGLLDYRATGRVYRETDIGVTMQISRHPSYLPLELMASGVPMVAPDSDWFRWLFESGENSLLTMRSVDGLVQTIDRLITDDRLRRKLGANAVDTIESGHSDWDTALDGVWEYMVDPA